MLLADTDPQTEAVLINLLRQASPARKLAMVAELTVIDYAEWKERVRARQVSEREVL